MSGLSDDTRALLEAARDGDEPSADDRARVRSAIARKIALGAAAGAAVATASHVAGGATSAAAGAGTAGAVGAASAASVVAASTTTSIAAGSTAAAVATGLGAKILVSVAIVGAVGAGTVTYAKHEAARKAEATMSLAAPAPQAAKTPSTVSAPKPVAPAPMLIAPPPEPPPSTSAALPAPPPPAPPAAVAAPAAPSTSPLDAELALLQDAHTALRAGDGERALRLYADHARRFPSGQLAEEAEAGRVFALCEVGRIDEARDVASRFLREHPRSPLAPRVARACEADAPSTY